MTTDANQYAAVSVRPMQAADAAAIVAMANALAAAVEDPPSQLTEAGLIRDGIGAQRKFDCFVAAEGGTLVGFTLACWRFEAHVGKPKLWIGDFYVRPQSRKGGTGRALMAALATHALENGCDEICWELWRPNTVGRGFYAALGAKPVDDLDLFQLKGVDLHALAARAG